MRAGAQQTSFDGDRTWGREHSRRLLTSAGEQAQTDHCNEVFEKHVWPAIAAVVVTMVVLQI